MAPDGLERLLRDLARPDAYPHSVDAVAVCQTHISCVFLTGPYAYKVKKPVDFGFLDYRLPERRLHYCREELRLNRRLCPELYLDVLPVVERAGRLQVGGEGPVVDWTLRMRQLSADRMLPALLACGAVSEAEIQEIAGVLARFHAAADRGGRIEAFGRPALIAGNVLQSLPDDAVDPALLPPAQRGAIEAYQRGFLAAGTELFRRRAAEGWIREGHGDLRLQNICLDQGPQIFDCIEFTDRFRYLDIVSDLAYLAIDLDLAGRADLRRGLLRAYHAALPDPDSGALAPFYGCFRACVRGKIAHLASLEPEIPGPERQQQAEIAAAAFDLALAYARPRPRPELRITIGFSGSGKSRAAFELARRLPAVYLAADRVRKELAGAAATDRLGEPGYSPERVAAVYAELRSRAAEWLRAGEHVVLDATFLSADERAAAAALAAECGAAFRVMHCTCPDPELRRRLERRSAAGTDPSDAGLAIYERQRAAWDAAPPPERERAAWQELDTAGRFDLRPLLYPPAS